MLVQARCIIECNLPEYRSCRVRLPQKLQPQIKNKVVLMASTAMHLSCTHLSVLSFFCAEKPFAAPTSSCSLFTLKTALLVWRGNSCGFGQSKI